MKKLYTLTLLLLLSIGVTMAQDALINVTAFEALPNDMDARVHNMRKDQNDSVAALIKVETTIKGFEFDNGTMGIVDVDATKIGETWVWVPYGTINFTIKHNIYGVLRYQFPESIKSATVYRLKLSTAKVTTTHEQSADGQYIVLKTTPANVEFIIDNGTPITIENGEYTDFLSYGEHTYSVRSKFYKSSGGVVKIGAEREHLKVDLVPNFGYLDITTQPSGATVEINGREEGVTPFKTGRLELGEYQLRISAPNYEPITQSVTLSEATVAKQVTYSLSSYYTGITIKSLMADAEILVNEQSKGIGSWSGELLPGRYEVKGVKDGHRSSVTALLVERGKVQTLTIAAPTPMYGKLNIDSKESGITASIDGKVLGDIPNIFNNVLVGKRTLTLLKDGFIIESTQVEIKEGQITAHKQQGYVLQVREDIERRRANKNDRLNLPSVFNALATKANASLFEARSAYLKGDYDEAYKKYKSCNTIYILPESDAKAYKISGEESDFNAINDSATAKSLKISLGVSFLENHTGSKHEQEVRSILSRAYADSYQFGTANSYAQTSADRSYIQECEKIKKNQENPIEPIKIAWGTALEMDFASGSGAGFSYLLPAYVSVGTSMNRFNLISGVQYRYIGGMNSSELYEYVEVELGGTYGANEGELYDIDADHLPSLRAHQISIPLHLRVNLGSRKRRQDETAVEWFASVGASYNFNISGAIARECMWNEEEYDYTKTERMKLNGYSIVNSSNISSYLRLGMSIRGTEADRSWTDIALVMRYDVSPLYNTDVLNSTIEYNSVYINFYESYEYIRKQTEAKMFIGFSFTTYWR